MTGSNPNRAGMVCFNRAGEILILTALNNPNEWILPKGHINPGESPWEAAEREVREEAGVDAIVDSIESIAFTTHTYQGEQVITEWFGGLARGAVEPGDSTRTVTWASWREAIELLSFESLRQVVKVALCHIWYLTPEGCEDDERPRS